MPTLVNWSNSAIMNDDVIFLRNFFEFQGRVGLNEGRFLKHFRAGKARRCSSNDESYFTQTITLKHSALVTL